MVGSNRKSGIGVVGDVPWGTHLCQFYQTKEDLIEILVPYFKAGLENNEFCMWITSEPLQVEEAKAALKKAVINLDDYIKKGQIEILDYSEWYTRSGKFDTDEVLQGWVDKEKLALEKGLDGLRLTGNTFWLEPKDWKDFNKYEVALDGVIGKYRMLAICSYSLEKCGASDVIGVMSSHRCSLVRREGQWQLVESVELKRMEEALSESKQNYRNSIENLPLGIRIVTAEGELIYANQAILDIYGYSSIEEFATVPTKQRYTPESYAEHQERKEKRKRGEFVPSNYEISIVRKDGEVCHLSVFRREVIWNDKTQFQVLYEDITERKQNEERREFTNRLLEIANSGTELTSTLQAFVKEVKRFTGCAAVGIRILDSKGNIPYQAYEGFSRRFYESESPLSIKSDQCMCINVIRGDTNPSLSFYTENGSFYINGTTAFLATVPEEEKGHTRNVCNECGYESVALVPMRLGTTILGLIHMVDTRTDMVPLTMVRVLEESALQIGLSLRRLWAERELKEEKERLRVTLRSTGDAVIATDTEEKVTLLNRVAENLTGWTQEEAVGKRLEEIFHIVDERTRRRIKNPVQRVFKTGRIVGLVNHAILISRDGTERTIADSGAPIHDEAGNLFGVVLVFRDITETRRLEEELRKVDKLESVGTLAGGIAHDFNNFLTGIMGNISLVRRYMEPGSEAEDRLLEAEKASLRARDLTQQLLTFARGGAPIRKTVSITKLLKESATFALRGSNIKCEFSLPDGLWPVEIDEGQISQVINNVVINAEEAMPKGGIIEVGAKNIVIRRRRGLPLSVGNYVEITIEDHGVGIPKDILPRIFEPYFTTKQKGSGLGLATSFSIVKNHDGYIAADSAVGVGTSVYIYLPASKKSIPAKKAEVAEARITGKGRVLVMDDEDMIRLLLSRILTGGGYEVELTKNGEEAIELYQKAKESGQPFDALILDLTIAGGMGGKEAIRRLLEIDPNVKAIVSSGYSTDPIMSEFKDYGFSGVAAKPYEITELEETLRKIITGKGG